MNFKQGRSALVFVSLFTLAACRGDDPGDGSGGSSSGGATTTTGGSSESTSPTVPTGTDPTTGVVDPSTTTTTGVDPDTGNESCAFIGNCTEPMESTGPGDPLPDGSMCSTDDECASMNCYTIPMFGGFCAECNEDADCVEAGTGISCSIDLFSMNAVCAPGVEGNNCESDAACMDPLVCAAVIETGGFLPLDTCGECADSSMCMNGELCSPVLMGIGGSNQCVAPGSVANDALCPTNDAEGDMACMSGFCDTVTVMGILNVPVCGECSTDMDCMMGMTCMPGAFDVNTFSFTGTTCG
jgi:hypothetical protein